MISVKSINLCNYYIAICPDGNFCPKRCCKWRASDTGWGCCNQNRGVCCTGAMDGMCCPRHWRCRTFFFPAFLKIFWINLKFVFIISISYRGGSRGRVQGVRTPPSSPEMTCGFLIQLVFCKKKTMWFIGVEVEQETSASPPKKNRGSAPELVSFKYRK